MGFSLYLYGGGRWVPSSLHFEVLFPLLSTLSRCSIRKESRDFTMNHQIMNSTTNNLLEEVMLGTCPNTNSEQQLQEKRLKPFPDQYLKCPRCDSTNTKFCYYNNYSLSQPRYFCKGCRRYWTQGGSLRNVPIGGGCRKNKRSYSSCSSVTSRRTQDQTVSTPSSPMLPHLQTQLAYDTNDLTHAFTGPQKPINTSTHYDPFLLNNCNPLNSTTGFLDILRGGGFLRTNTCGYQNLCYGFSLDGNVYEPNVQPVSPLIEGSGVAAMIKQEVTCKGMVGENKGVVVDKQCKQVGTDGNIIMDNGRDYWYGAGTGAASAWHGLINSSLM